MARQHRVVDHIVDRLAAAASNISSVSTARTSKTFMTQRISAMTSPQCWPNTSSRRPPWPTDTAAATARLGVVIATSGGGALNLVPDWGSRWPAGFRCWRWSASRRQSMDGRGSFQDTSGRNGSLDAVGVVLRGVVVLRAGDQPRRHRRRAGRGDRRRPPRRTRQLLLLPKDIQQGSVDISATESRRRISARGNQAIRSRSSGRCAMPAARSPSSPASRWPGTTPAPNSSTCGRCCGARVATVPDAKDVGAPGPRPRGDRGDGPSRRRRRGPDSALCLMVGTRLTVTARAGLDDALAAVPTVSIGRRRTVCAVHARPDG